MLLSIKLINSAFDNSEFVSLEPGKTVNTTLLVDVNTNEEGNYEIDVTANVENPSFKDFGKVVLVVKEGRKVEERILFTEELIASNPECAEIKELVDQAQKYLADGNFSAADSQIGEAISACTKAISYKPSQVLGNSLQNSIFTYTIIGSVAAVFLGLFYYYYRRMKISKSIKGF